MGNAVKIRTLTAPPTPLNEFDPGAYLSEREFYETNLPITEEDREGLAQFVHFLAFLALQTQSSQWGASLVPQRSQAYRALESHFGHLPDWPEATTDELPYRQLAGFLMKHYPPHPPNKAETLIREMAVDLSGLGFILYSPPAVSHIPEGSDYLHGHFWKAEDVAEHVLACQLTGFCTGSGTFRLRFSGGPLDEIVIKHTEFKIRLGLQVRGGAICARDLDDLVQWRAACPPEQQIAVADGWYRLTVYSDRPDSGIIGDDQLIEIHLEPMDSKPPLQWYGVPQLFGTYDAEPGTPADRPRD